MPSCVFRTNDPPTLHSLEAPSLYLIYHCTTYSSALHLSLHCSCCHFVITCLWRAVFARNTIPHQAWIAVPTAAFSRPFPQEILQRSMREFTPQALSNIGWAYATIGHFREDLMQALAVDACAKLPTFSAQVWLYGSRLDRTLAIAKNLTSPTLFAPGENRRRVEPATFVPTGYVQHGVGHGDARLQRPQDDANASIRSAAPVAQVQCPGAQQPCHCVRARASLRRR